MALPSAFKSAEPYVVSLGVPLLAAALGVMLPVQFAQQAKLGEIGATIADMKTDTARIAAEAKTVAARIATEGKAEVTKVADTLDKLVERLDKRDTDPSTLLAKLLGTAPANVDTASFAYVKGKLYAFPKTETTKRQFMTAGFVLEQVSPTIEGFVLEQAPKSNPTATGTSGAAQ